MTDHATPNLPSRDFGQTAEFYQRLGFTENFRDDGWMILTRGSLTVEFFPHPDLNPMDSSFSCCLRLDDLDGFYAECVAAHVPVSCWGMPRLKAPEVEDGGLRIAYLIDPEGSLVRLIQN